MNLLRVLALMMLFNCFAAGTCFASAFAEQVVLYYPGQQKRMVLFLFASGMCLAMTAWLYFGFMRRLLRQYDPREHMKAPDVERLPEVPPAASRPQNGKIQE